MKTEERQALKIFETKAGKNICTRYRGRTLNNRTTKEIRVYITRGIYCEIYKIPSTELVQSCWKNAKPKMPPKKKSSSYNGINEKTRKITQNMEKWGLRGRKDNGPYIIGNEERLYWRPNYLKLRVHAQITNSLIIYNYFSNRLLLRPIISANPPVSPICTAMRNKGGGDVSNTSF